MHYLKDPDAIYARSFAIIGEEVDLSSLAARLRPVATRLIHACGMTDILPDLRIDEAVVPAVRAALADGRPILADCEMLKSAIISRHLPPGTEIICTLNHPDAASAASASASPAPAPPSPCGSPISPAPSCASATPRPRSSPCSR
jgi:precorrin-8X/cobalt-precorrin-8 methylmutase